MVALGIPSDPAALDPGRQDLDRTERAGAPQHPLQSVVDIIGLLIPEGAHFEALAQNRLQARWRTATGERNLVIVLSAESSSQLLGTDLDAAKRARTALWCTVRDRLAEQGAGDLLIQI